MYGGSNPPGTSQKRVTQKVTLFFLSLFLTHSFKFEHERGILCAKLVLVVKFVQERGILCAKWVLVKFVHESGILCAKCSCRAPVNAEIKKEGAPSF